MYEIALVIPVLNEAGGIAATLSRFSLEANNKVIFVVVDNGSKDTTLKEIEKWRKKNPERPFKLLKETRKGSIYARRKGLFKAKYLAKAVISTDADCKPITGFFNNIKKDFVNDKTAGILKGSMRSDPYTRLVLRLYLPNLIKLMAAQERFEVNLFGDFYAGGYFGIKSQLINNYVFTLDNIPTPKVPSVFWAKHCYYLGYKFKASKPDLRVSSRRFWKDPDGFIYDKRAKLIRGEQDDRKKKVRQIKLISKKEKELICIQGKVFSTRLLMFLLDALFFEKGCPNKKIVSLVIRKNCQYFDIEENEVRIIQKLSLEKAKRKILKDYQERVLTKLSKDPELKPFL